MYIRGDLINAFNWKNYSDYNVDWGSNGVYFAEHHVEQDRQHVHVSAPVQD